MKDLWKNKYVIICAIVLIIVLLLCLFMFKKNNKLTNLEKVKIEEVSNDIIEYLDEITDNEDESSKYISFAIEYLYDNYSKESFSIDEVLKVINKYFDNDYTVKKIIDTGITPYLADKGVVFDRSNDTFTYNKKETRLDIASQPIVKYELKEIKKISNDKFKVIYNKYVVKDPYKLLNYYNDFSISSSKAEYKDISDQIAIISNYLKGSGDVKEVKKLINKDNISKIGEIKDDVEVVYTIVDEKLKIEKIK